MPRGKGHEPRSEVIRKGKVTFQFSLSGTGWAEADISDGSQHAALTASYLSDALGDLTRAVISLVQGATFAMCAWAEEPGEYRWLFEREGEELDIKIVWYDDWQDLEPEDSGTLQFTTRCKLRRFAGQVHQQLWRLLEEVGQAEYERLWRGDFPMRDYERLGKLMQEQV